MDNVFFFRDGSPVTPADVRLTATGKPFVVVSSKCCRCGGTGIYTKFHGECYRCGGRGQTPSDVREVRVFTAEQNAKLDKAQAARADKRFAAGQAKADAFDAQHPQLVADAEAFGGALVGLLNSGRHFGSLSEKQLAFAQALAVEGTARVEREAARAAERAQVAATSTHLGTIGERLSLAVTVTAVGSFERARFGRPDQSQTVWVVTFTTANGNVLVTKMPTLNAEVGTTGVLTGTVKAHDVYRDVKQTQLQRAKFDDDAA
jgi:hypothetical protein